MQGAVDSVLQQVPAGRQDLHPEEVVVGIVTIDLAEVGGFSAPNQRLHQLELLGAPNIGLEVSAARGTALVVAGAAGCFGTGVGHICNRQCPRGHLGGGKISLLQALLVDELESVTTQLTLLPLVFHRIEVSGEAVCTTKDRAVALLLQVSAGDMNPGGDPQFVIILERGSEFDPLGMSQHPGGVVVFITLNHRDSEGDVEGAALSAQTVAGWRGHSGPR